VHNEGQALPNFDQHHVSVSSWQSSSSTPMQLQLLQMSMANDRGGGIAGLAARHAPQLSAIGGKCQAGTP
jgi:hypothetical protein